MHQSTIRTNPQPSYGQPCAIVPILSLIGHMPRPGEDIALLVKCALEYEADREDREPLSFTLPTQRDASGHITYTGVVHLYRFSPSEEKSYLEEQHDLHQGDVSLLTDEVFPDLDLTSEEPAGERIPSIAQHTIAQQERSMK